MLQKLYVGFCDQRSEQNAIVNVERINYPVDIDGNSIHITSPQFQKNAVDDIAHFSIL